MNEWNQAVRSYRAAVKKIVVVPPALSTSPKGHGGTLSAGIGDYDQCQELG